MDAREETENLLGRVWVKLRGLPDANPADLGGFLVLLSFILMVVFLAVLTCVSCCCCCGGGRKAKMTSPDA